MTYIVYTVINKGYVINNELYTVNTVYVINNELYSIHYYKQSLCDLQ